MKYVGHGKEDILEQSHFCIFYPYDYKWKYNPIK